jgi:hypothetical protein
MRKIAPGRWRRRAGHFISEPSAKSSPGDAVTASADRSTSRALDAATPIHERPCLAMMRRSFPGSSASSAKVRPAGGGDAVVKWDPTGQQYVQVEAPENAKSESADRL